MDNKSAEGPIDENKNENSRRNVELEFKHPETDVKGVSDGLPQFSRENVKVNVDDIKGGENFTHGIPFGYTNTSGDVNMEAPIEPDDLIRAGGYGARDDISSFLPVASDSTDFEATIRDARGYEEPQEEIGRPGLGWKEATETNLESMSAMSFTGVQLIYTVVFCVGLFSRLTHHFASAVAAMHASCLTSNCFKTFEVCFEICYDHNIALLQSVEQFDSFLTIIQYRGDKM